MKYSGVTRSSAALLLTVAILACNREQPARAPVLTAPADTPAAAVAAPVVLEDVLVITPAYVIGISYPQPAVAYPALAAQLQRYAQTQRSEFLEAVEARDAADTMLYDLSLSFTGVVDSPQLVAYAAEGSSFTGGAHGAPLLARFVWLTQHDKRLASTDLVTTDSGWRAISTYVKEQLHGALSQRVDADDLAPGERAAVIKSAGRMIDEGTDPDPVNFAEFEPVVDAAGRVTALRFVFPPYQVGPYSDGVQTVEVPAVVLMPYISPQYRSLFLGG